MNACQLRCRTQVADDACVCVQLQCRSGAGSVQVALYGSGNTVCLVFAPRYQNDFLGTQDSAYTHRDGAGRYLFYCTEEALGFVLGYIV